jgi:hypothetical protein
MTAIPALPFGFHGYPDLPGFAKENRELVYAMADAGWTGRMTSKGHFLAKAPDGKTTITVPAKNGSNRGLKNSHATFMRWMREQLSPELTALWDKAKQEDDPEIKDILAESVVKKHAVEIMNARDERVHHQIIEAIENGVITVEPLVRPYLARKHSGKDGGTRYESQTTLERVWPDGKTDYVCAICEWESENPRSVAMHYGQEHTRKGQTDPAGEGPHVIDPDYTEPLTTRDYRPTQRLLAAATEMIYGLMYEDGVNAEDIALAFLTWAHDRPDIEHVERPLVPLTDKQILDKVRMLVGQPDQSEEITALSRRVAELEGEVTRLTEERRALRDLLSDDGV